jgi:hypothetical protein
VPVRLTPYDRPVGDGELHHHAGMPEVEGGSREALRWLLDRLLRQGIVAPGGRLMEPVLMVAATVTELRSLLAELDHEVSDPRVRELVADLREMLEGAPEYV